jgi:hypothetical protein
MYLSLRNPPGSGQELGAKTDATTCRATITPITRIQDATFGCHQSSALPHPVSTVSVGVSSFEDETVYVVRPLIGQTNEDISLSYIISDDRFVRTITPMS